MVVQLADLMVVCWAVPLVRKRVGPSADGWVDYLVADWAGSWAACWVGEKAVTKAAELAGHSADVKAVRTAAV